MAGNVALENTFIWVDGSNSRFTKQPDSVYHQAIDSAIELLEDRLKTNGVYIKLRPGTTNFQSNYLYSALTAKGISVNVLPDKLVLECVFIRSRSCTVVGNLSSSLFYARIFGHDSYSIYSLYEKRGPTIFDQMPGYWTVVKKL